MYDSNLLFLELTPEIRELLEDNKIDLEQEIRRGGLDVRRASASNPSPEARTAKDIFLALTIVSAGATASLVGIAVAKILDAVGRNRKVFVTESELRPVVDRHGHAMFEANGKPLVFWAETHRLIEASM